MINKFFKCRFSIITITIANILCFMFLYSYVSEKNKFVEPEFSRDFYRYKCKNMTRVGGQPEFLARAKPKSNLYRVEGFLKIKILIAVFP